MRTKVKKSNGSNFIDRINFILSKLTTNQEFSSKTGIRPDRVDELSNGSEPTYKELVAIIDGFPMIVEKWLLTGQGVSLKEDTEWFEKLSDYSDICQRFRRERLDHDYTQDEWGKIFNRARPTIAAIETNRQAFPFDIARIWHRKFNRSYSYIIDGVDEDITVPKLLERISKLEQDKEFLKKLLTDKKD